MEKEPEPLTLREKIATFVFDPRVTKALKISSGVLDILHKSSAVLKNPLAILPVAGSAFQLVRDTIAVNNSAGRALIIREGLVDAGSSVGALLLRSNAISLFKVETITSLEEHEYIQKVTIDSESAVWLYKPSSYDQMRCYIKRGDTQSVKKLLREVFLRVGGMGLEVSKTSGGGESDYGGEHVTFQPIPSNIYTNHELDKLISFANQINDCWSHQESPAYVFHGPPGTGKTSFAISLAELMNLRVLLIGPSALGSLGAKGFYEIVQSLNAGMLILDDADRSWEMSIFYVALNHIRLKMPKMVTIVTTNNLGGLTDAFLRPGRGGELVFFEPPTLERKKEILVESGCPTTTGLDIEALAKMIHPKATHDWVRSIGNRIARIKNPTQDRAAKALRTINTNFKVAEYIGLDNSDKQFVEGPKKKTQAQVAKEQTEKAAKATEKEAKEAAAKKHAKPKAKDSKKDSTKD